MLPTPSTPTEPVRPLPFYRHLYFQVLVAIALGVLLGHYFPATGEAMKPQGDAFIALVRMIIAPVIFLTIVTGIAGMKELGAIGRVAAKAFAYFLTFSTLALIVGLIIANVVQPGAGLNIDPATLDASKIADYAQQAHDRTLVAFLLNVIPATLVSAVADGHNILQVLFVAILFGIALSMIGEKAEPLMTVLESASLAIFKLVSFLMKAAPFGAFGAMAFTVAKYGVGTLANLAGLVATFYLTSLLFVLVVLGTVAWFAGFNILHLIRYLRAELLLVLGTSSSEAALPSLIEKMEQAGCRKSVVGLVVPTGYSFNLDGSMMYATFATIFIAQAYGIDLPIATQITILLVLMVTSKGIAAVPRASLVVVAATLGQFDLPVEGVAFILAVDHFMDMGRTATNVLGNAIATSVITKWEGMLEVEEPVDVPHPKAPAHTPSHGRAGLELASDMVDEDRKG